MIGCSSLVGSRFVETFSNRYEFHAIGRKNIFQGTDLLTSFTRLDITKGARLQNLISSSGAEHVVNFAAETDVDGSEREKDDLHGRVYLTNAGSVSRIAQACRQSRKKLYQISTDAVFDGATGPYDEFAQPGPIHSSLSWYGCTKFLAEREIARILPDHCILRISHPYRSKFRWKGDFARNILSMFRRGSLYPLFTDQTISPTFIDEVGFSLDLLIKRDTRGVYHVASKNVTTPFDFAHRLISVFFSPDAASSLPKNGSIHDSRYARGRAPRPIQGGLLTTRLTDLGLEPRTFEEGINEMFKQCKTEVITGDYMTAGGPEEER